MDLSSSPGSDSENTCRFFKHFCFCAPCSTVGAVPLLKLSRNRQSANVKVLYFVGSDQKCGTKFPACYAYWWQNKKKKQFFLVSRQVLSFKKNHVRLRTDSILQCVFLRFSTCCLHVYSRLTTTTQWGDTILSLSESCLLSNPIGKTSKTSSSKQVILQMHSSCFSFKDMTKTASCFEIARKSETQSHTDTRDNLEISCEYSICTSKPAL